MSAHKLADVTSF